MKCTTTNITVGASARFSLPRGLPAHHGRSAFTKRTMADGTTIGKVLCARVNNIHISYVIGAALVSLVCLGEKHV